MFDTPDEQEIQRLQARLDAIKEALARILINVKAGDDVSDIDGFRRVPNREIQNLLKILAEDEQREASS